MADQVHVRESCALRRLAVTAMSFNEQWPVPDRSRQISLPDRSVAAQPSFVERSLANRPGCWPRESIRDGSSGSRHRAQFPAIAATNRRRSGKVFRVNRIYLHLVPKMRG